MSDLLLESVSRMNEQFLACMEKDSDAFSVKLRNCPRNEIYIITPDYLTPYLSYIGKMPSVIFSFVLMITPPCDHIDRTVHPAYNYTQENQKFKYW